MSQGFTRKNAQYMSGSVVQMKFAKDDGNVSTASAIPWDDTIPQSNEGAELLSVTITPQFADSLLFIQVSAQVGQCGNNQIFALFRDSQADAFQARQQLDFTGVYNGSASFAFSMSAYITANSTASTTIKLRFGGSVNNNYNGSSRIFGGVCHTVMSVVEVRP